MEKINVKNYINNLNIIAILVDNKTNENITNVKKIEVDEEMKLKFQVYLHTFLSEKEYRVDLELMRFEEGKFQKRKINEYYWNKDRGFFPVSESEPYEHKRLETVGLLNDSFSTLELILNVKLDKGEYEMLVLVKEKNQKEQDKKVITSCSFLVL